MGGNVENKKPKFNFTASRQFNVLLFEKCFFQDRGKLHHTLLLAKRSQYVIKSTTS